MNIDSSIAAEFSQKFADFVENMTLNADYDLSADMGSLASADQVKTIETHVEDALDKGATLLAGGRKRVHVVEQREEPAKGNN